MGDNKFMSREANTKIVISLIIDHRIYNFRSSQKRNAIGNVSYFIKHDIKQSQCNKITNKKKRPTKQNK